MPAIDESFFWGSAVVGVILAPIAILLLRFGIRPVQHILGIIEIDDTIPNKVEAKIRQRCNEANLVNLSDHDCEALLETIAKAAIVEAFTEHFGRPYVQKSNWPEAKCVINSGIAVIRPYIGADYRNTHGVRSINIRVIREVEIHDIRQAKDRIRGSAARAAQQFEIPNGQPIAASKNVPKPAPKQAAPARIILSESAAADKPAPTMAERLAKRPEPQRKPK